MTNYVLNKDCSVVFSPPFDDSELFSITMSLELIELQFEAFESDDTLEVVRVIGKRPTLLQFTSDHLQNVVARVLIFKNGDTVRAENSTLGLQLISDAKLQNICNRLENSQSLLVVCPISGPELVAIVETVEIVRTRTMRA